MKTKDLSNSIAATYKWLRLGVGLIAFAFPLILWGGGYLSAQHLPLQGSMSAYYHAGDAVRAGQGVMRNEFVGILFAIGTILWLYKGMSRLEDWLLNFAGAFALGVALFPMTWPENSVPQDRFFFLHGFFALVFFLCVGLVCILCASDTLSVIKDEDEAKYKRYRRSYFILGVLMVVLPLSAAGLKFYAPWRDWTIFCVEVAGIYVFSAFWLLKSYELSQTDLDGRVARGELHILPHPLSDTLLLRPLKIVPIDDPK
jgi:cytochrome b561